jgi:hypothetical protein
VDRHNNLVWKSRSCCACPQLGPGFPHYIFVPVHSQDLDLHITFVCLSTARTWISTLNCCAYPGSGCGQAQKCSVEIQVLAVDRHKHLVPHYIFVPVHSQDLDFHTTCVCLSTARTWVSTLHCCGCPQPGHVVWKSRSWLWTGTKM